MLVNYMSISPPTETHMASGKIDEVFEENFYDVCQIFGRNRKNRKRVRP